jgi:hypothetical protein
MLPRTAHSEWVGELLIKQASAVVQGASLDPVNVIGTAKVGTQLGMKTAAFNKHRDDGALASGPRSALIVSKAKRKVHPPPRGAHCKHSTVPWLWLRRALASRQVVHADGFEDECRGICLGPACAPRSETQALPSLHQSANDAASRLSLREPLASRNIPQKHHGACNIDGLHLLLSLTKTSRPQKQMPKPGTIRGDTAGV